MAIKTTNVNASNIPIDAIEYLRPFAQRDGQSGADAAVVRWAVIQQEKLIRNQQSQNNASAT